MTTKTLDPMILMVVLVLSGLPAAAQHYPVVDTGQVDCYDASDAMACPATGQAFYGQDAQHTGNTPAFTDNGDGTVTDQVTGLMWLQSPDTDDDGDIDAADKLTWIEAGSYPAVINAQVFAGHTDWRLPTIKDLYSLIDFRGVDPSGYSGPVSGLIPFIDTGFFDFAYGDTASGERIIDAQYWSSTEYVSTTMNGAATVFGVNFADGRIKGYPRDFGPGGTSFTQYIRLVRGNPDYGVNDFVDNSDGTVTDNATWLMWSQTDSGVGLNWEEALAWVELRNAEGYLGYSDWRLPNIKELQSILDYSRSPATSGSAAIDPVFSATSLTNEAGETDYPSYWSGTTHANWTIHPGAWGSYVAFGRAMGYMQGSWTDVHGAGAQRSDPKEGDPAGWPTGNGPQGDAIRIYNYVRLVRGSETGLFTDGFETGGTSAWSASVP